MLSLTNVKSCGKRCPTPKASHTAPYVFWLLQNHPEWFPKSQPGPNEQFLKTILWMCLLPRSVYNFNFFISSYSVLIDIMVLSRNSREQCCCTQSGTSSGRRKELCFSKSSWATFQGRKKWSAKQVRQRVENRTGRSGQHKQRQESSERGRKDIQNQVSKVMDVSISPRMLGVLWRLLQSWKSLKMVGWKTRT